MEPAQHRLAGARTCAPASRPTSQFDRWRSLWLRLIDIVVAWRRIAADRHHLAELNEYYLRDIGLTRDFDGYSPHCDPRE